MKSPRSRGSDSAYLSPSPTPPPRGLSPTLSEAVGYDAYITMAANSRDGLSLQPRHTTESLMSSAPSLSEILSNTAPPPWTLSAFMAYLSQNHCMETLEFTIDAERYRMAFEEEQDEDDDVEGAAAWGQGRADHLRSLWQKIMHVYIIPSGPREVNLPSRVRDRLLGLSTSPDPPSACELDEAVSIVYELMNDSVLVPFLAAMASPQLAIDDAVQVEDAGAYQASRKHRSSRQGRSRSRATGDARSSREESSRSPKTSFLPQLNMGRLGPAHRSGTSSMGGDALLDYQDALTDDTGSSASPAATEPMTPPTTPPTSDWNFSTSPGSLQRAVSAHNAGWRKVGAKLGLSRKGRSKRSHPSDPSISEEGEGSSRASLPDGSLPPL
jgi:hypothetical protein